MIKKLKEDINKKNIEYDTCYTDNTHLNKKIKLLNDTIKCLENDKDKYTKNNKDLTKKINDLSKNKTLYVDMYENNIDIKNTLLKEQEKNMELEKRIKIELEPLIKYYKEEVETDLQ